jgi:hypothetical protein
MPAIEPSGPVILVILAVAFGTLFYRMIRARRDPRFVVGFALIAVGFFVVELAGAPSGNTLSESALRSVTLRWMETGTLIIGIALEVHWWLLDRWLPKQRIPYRVRLLALGPEAQPDPAHSYLSIRRFVPTSGQIANGYMVARIIDLWVNSNASGNCFGLVFDANNNADLNAVMLQHWPGNISGLELPAHRNISGQAEASFVMSGFDPANGPGPYTVDLKMPSDALVGGGLPNNRHEEIWIVWREEVVPPSNIQGATLEETAINAAIAKKPWMPINTDGALYKFALSTKGPRLPSGQISPNLGYPQTDEWEFDHKGVTYIGQVYNLAIVYVKKGDPQWQCAWVAKPEGV